MKYTFSAFDIDDPSTLQLIATNDIDGIAVLGRCDKDLLKFLKKHFQYVVYSGLNNLDAKYDQIICDGAEISHAVVSRLIEQGHNKIAYIGESQNENRYIGYCSALEKAGISINPEYVTNIVQSTEEGYNGVRALLANGCDATAFFCADDITAIGAMKASKNMVFAFPKTYQLPALMILIPRST